MSTEEICQSLQSSRKPIVHRDALRSIGRPRVEAIAGENGVIGVRTECDESFEAFVVGPVCHRRGSGSLG